MPYSGRFRTRHALTAAIVFGLSATIALDGLRADGGNRLSPERLIPEDGKAVTPDVNFREKVTDDYHFGEAFLRAPLVEGEDGYLMIEGSGLYGQDWQFNRDYYQGSLGLFYRHEFADGLAGGVNSFADFGEFEEFLGQFSFGFELEAINADATTFRLGGNGYLPLEDYTKDRDLDRAPRPGGDLYLGLGQQWPEHLVEGYVTGFYYGAGDEGKELWGGLAELEWRYSGFDFVPQGSHLYASAGARYDTYEDGLSPTFGLGFTIALHDDDAPLERVAEVRRNIAYGSAFVPIEYQAIAAAITRAPLVPISEDLGCGPGGASTSEQLAARLDLSSGPGGVAPIGTTVLDLFGLDAIINACTFTFGGGEGTPTTMVTVSQCVEEMAALDRDPTQTPAQGLSTGPSSGRLVWNSDIRSCETNFDIFSG